MKNKKIIILFVILFCLVIIGGYFGIRYVKNREENTEVEEYVPEEEITEEQMRQTSVSLYFVSKETGELTPEARMIDIKELMEKPYEKLMELLLQGPKNDKLQKIIPDNTKCLSIKLEGDCLTIDFSKELLDYDKSNINNKANLINSIVDTMTELTEVNQVKFLVEGNINEEFDDSYVRNTNSAF